MWTGIFFFKDKYTLVSAIESVVVVCECSSPSQPASLKPHSWTWDQDVDWSQQTDVASAVSKKLWQSKTPFGKSRRTASSHWKGSFVSSLSLLLVVRLVTPGRENVPGSCEWIERLKGWRRFQTWDGSDEAAVPGCVSTPRECAAGGWGRAPQCLRFPPPYHLALIAKKRNDSYLRQRSEGRGGSGNLIPLNEFSTKGNETCGEASARGSHTVNESLHLIYLTRAS